MNDPNTGRPEPKPLVVSHPHLKEFLAFLPELNKETDRGMVMIACSFIDELMRRIVLSFLIEDTVSKSLVDGFNAPIGTFATRSAAAFTLGLISEQELGECDALRKIRRRFAHHVHVSFDDQNIRDLCKNLTMAAQDYGDVMVGARGQFSTAS